jgi:hypothetical protein
MVSSHRAGQWFNVSYSVWFNRRHGRCGHLFQGRFKSVVVNPVEWGLALSRYVHLNPVRVGRLGLDRGPSVGAIEGPGGVGGEEFLENLRRHVVGNAREQRGVRRLAVACPTLSEVIASVEKVKGESWGEFRDRHGDSGRDLVLYLGRRRCGLKLQELAGAAGMTDYRTVSIAIRRFQKRLRRSQVEQKQFEQVCQLSNIEM